MVGTTLLHYQIEELLGRGAMGAVYKAFDTRLEVFRALKFLQHDFTDRSSALDHLLREARTQAKLTHPNIATLYDLCETDQHTFLIMEFVDGPTLDRFLKEHNPTLEERLLILMQISSAIQVAHTQGVLHRDIKPQNVLVAADGTAKVTDFGLAKVLGQTTLSLTGETKGTAPYMAPEIYRGESVTETGDIWSIGILTYQVLTGKLPFQGRTFEETALSILNDEYPPLPEEMESTLPGITAFLEKCLQKDPLKRISNGGQAFEALLEVAEKAGIQTSTRVALTVPPRTMSRGRQRRLLAAAGATVVIATAIISTGRIGSMRPVLIETGVIGAGQSSPTWVDGGTGIAMLGTLGGQSIEYRRVPLGEEGVSEMDLPGGYEWDELSASPAGSLYALTGTRQHPGLYLFSTGSDSILQLNSDLIRSPSWSSDGRILVYTKMTGEPGEEISRLERCVLDTSLADGFPDCLEYGPIECSGLPQPGADLALYNPVFIMDDSRIAFVVSRGARVLGIWGIPAEGGEAERIETSGILPWILRWDNNRRILLFSTSNNGAYYTLRFTKQGTVRGRPHQMQIDEMANSFEYSADTGRLALLTSAFSQPIYQLPFPDSENTGGQVADGFLYTPAISEDGRKLVYSEVLQPGGLQLRQMDLRSRTVINYLADDPGILNEYAPALEPGDGRYLALLASARNHIDLYLYDRQENMFALQITDDEIVEAEPVWAPDGNSIYYASRVRPRQEDSPDRIIRCYLDRSRDEIRVSTKVTIIERRTLGYPRPSADGELLLFQTGGDSLGVLNLATDATRYYQLGRYPALTPSRRDVIFLDGSLLLLWRNWADTGDGEPDIIPIGRIPEEVSNIGVQDPKITASENAVFIPFWKQTVPELKIYRVKR